ncbi:hypothetical protein ACFT38_36865 [Streptomyces sp. NPDC056975]|uniref:hypothetical protein n=1 Tax=Streptomyces sp. NPDC056975 TaxID=3345985 RepID=UPI00362D8B3C
MDNEWEAGATPWLRRQQAETTWTTAARPVQCMFCGEQTVKRSVTDHDEDTGRLELYCDNGACDAREMILLVRRDGADASQRADVRALRLLDEGELDVNALFPPQEPKTYSMMDIMQKTHPPLVERRAQLPDADFLGRAPRKEN